MPCNHDCDWPHGDPEAASSGLTAAQSSIGASGPAVPAPPTEAELQDRAEKLRIQEEALRNREARLEARERYIREREAVARVNLDEVLAAKMRDAITHLEAAQAATASPELATARDSVERGGAPDAAVVLLTIMEVVRVCTPEAKPAVKRAQRAVRALAAVRIQSR